MEAWCTTLLYLPARPHSPANLPLSTVAPLIWGGGGGRGWEWVKIQRGHYFPKAWPDRYDCKGTGEGSGKVVSIMRDKTSIIWQPLLALFPNRYVSQAGNKDVQCFFTPDSMISCCQVHPKYFNSYLQLSQCSVAHTVVFCYGEILTRYPTSPAEVPVA